MRHDEINACCFGDPFQQLERKLGEQVIGLIGRMSPIGPIRPIGPMASLSLRLFSLSALSEARKKKPPLVRTEVLSINKFS